MIYYCEDCEDFVEGYTTEVTPVSINPPDTVCASCGGDLLLNADYCPLCHKPKLATQDICEECDAELKELSNKHKTDWIEDIQFAVNCDYDTAYELWIEYSE